MSINKAFVVKNGLEVNQKLLVANSSTGRVGIGTSLPSYLLDVAGGIGVTDVYAVGFATFTDRLNVGANANVLTARASTGSIGVGIGTNNPAVGVGSNVLHVYGNAVVTNGKVGIGTTSAPSLLSVTDTGTPTSGLTGCLADFSTNTNSYGQINVRNLSSGTNASSDVIVTADNGSDSSNYIDLGINNSGYSVGTWTVNGANDAYLYASDGSLSIGIATVNTAKYISFFAGGTSLSNEKVRINQTGVGINTTNPTSTLTVSGNTLITGVTTVQSSLFGTSASFTGVVTASSFVGSGASLTGNARNLTATIGIGTSGVPVGYGVSFLDLRGPGLSTVYYNSNVGIATIYLQGGGSGSASIGIGSTPGDAFVGVITAGNLWYNTTYGRLFIYYQDADSAQWVDAAPFNVGIITQLSNISFVSGSAINPSWYFDNSSTTGVFSPSAGQLTFVSTGASVLNINPSGINITGVLTASSFSGNASSATYATTAGIATYASNSGIATYATTAGVSTSVIGGIGSITQLRVTGIGTITDTRIQSVGEKTTLINGNTASLIYNTGGGNIAICTNPSGDITLAVTGIPTDSSFNNTAVTFSVFVNQTGTARSCTAVTLNGLNATIRWSGGSLASATLGVTTSNGMDIYNFSGINTVGSASTTANYYLLGVVNGGYR